MANNSILKSTKEKRNTVYRSFKGTSDKNIAKDIDLMGGNSNY